MSAEFEDLLRRIPEIERRLRNMVRYAKVEEIDAAKGLVKLIDEGEGDNQTIKTDWIPWAEVGGGIKTWRPPTKGQRMMMFSPSGQLHDAIAVSAAFSNENTQPSNKGDEIKETIGSSSVTVRGDSHVIKSPRIDLNPTSS
ncbi:MAG: phage baseplate assembly protein V [Hyphomicrobiaceae bacterium]|nr:phage baseplate assembly protein V [Hyphomicrobiaceae bacterium]